MGKFISSDVIVCYYEKLLRKYIFAAEASKLDNNCMMFHLIQKVFLVFIVSYDQQYILTLRMSNLQ